MNASGDLVLEDGGCVCRRRVIPVVGEQKRKYESTSLDINDSRSYRLYDDW